MHGRTALASLVTILSLLAAAPTSSSPAWSHDPGVNQPIVVKPGSQCAALNCTDGAGGALMAWLDPCPSFAPLVPGTFVVQHILRRGSPDLTWPANGRVISTTALDASMISDGAGGAFVGWGDVRGSSRDCYLQHVRANGTLDPAWPALGLALCTAVGNQVTLALVGDGSNGVIVVWSDRRDSATTSPDLYATHVLANGTLDPAWPVNGRAVCNAIGQQNRQSIVTDGAHGAYIAWDDRRNLAVTKADVYVAHLLANGTMDPAWPANGLGVATQSFNEQASHLTVDGAGGAFVAWTGSTFTGSTFGQACVQHVLATGVVDPAWPALGLLPPSMGSFAEVEDALIVSDGGTGVMFVWDAALSGGDLDVLAAHVRANGTFDPAWPGGYREIFAPGDQFAEAFGNAVVSDGSGGVIILWGDTRDGRNDFYSLRIRQDGTLNSSWNATGRAVCTAPSGDFGRGLASVTADGLEGAIYTWFDPRDSVATDYDIYAQLVSGEGRLGLSEPSIDTVRDVPADQGGHATIFWTSSSFDTLPADPVSSYEIWRKLDLSSSFAAERARARSIAPNGAPLPGDVKSVDDGVATTYWEFVGSAPGRGTSSYAFSTPTPQDSTAAGPAYQTYEVDVHLQPGNYVASSAPDSGYSVDNLAPPTPSGFGGAYSAGASALLWDPSIAGDLAGYELYRGRTSGFAPALANRVSSPTTTHYTDPAGIPYYYKLTAIDVHGNESAPTLLLPTGTAGVEDDALPQALALSRPSPDPARHETTLRFALPRAANASLNIYDAAGRRVRSLASGARRAGVWQVVWDLHDDQGRMVGPGVYFVRLDVGGESLSTPLVVLR